LNEDYVSITLVKAISQNNISHGKLFTQKNVIIEFLPEKEKFTLKMGQEGNG